VYAWLLIGQDEIHECVQLLGGAGVASKWRFAAGSQAGMTAATSTTRAPRHPEPNSRMSVRRRLTSSPGVVLQQFRVLTWFRSSGVRSIQGRKVRAQTSHNNRPMASLSTRAASQSPTSTARRTPSVSWDRISRRSAASRRPSAFTASGRAASSLARHPTLPSPPLRPRPPPLPPPPPFGQRFGQQITPEPSRTLPRFPNDSAVVAPPGLEPGRPFGPWILNWPVMVQWEPIRRMEGRSGGRLATDRDRWSGTLAV